MTIDSIADVRDYALQAGHMALQAQQEMGYDERRLKEDDSVLTAADLRVQRYLQEQIGRAYPEANVIGEERVGPADRADRNRIHRAVQGGAAASSRPYTFAIDPIDGTDVYSQGMHGWCVSIGLLDEALRPVAGVVYAPRLDLLVFADVGAAATVNGAPIERLGHPLPLDATTNIMAHSRVHRRGILARYPGKVRSIGSAALHICFTLVYPGIYAAVEGEGEHVWDIAGAHAVLVSHGYELTYLRREDGHAGELDYAALVRGEGAAGPMLAGRPERVRALRHVLMGGGS
ncbi:MAG: inositol monophosphatase family protein [Anaerolineae bacterium]|jgi:fructose-1,6-bisphosphatase/inositol monophosphatase family enzyme